MTGDARPADSPIDGCARTIARDPRDFRAGATARGGWIVVAVAALAAGTPPSLSAQLQPYVGVSGVWASMPEPYARDVCSGDVQQLLGAGVDVGVRRGAVSFEVGYRGGTQRGVDRCFFGSPDVVVPPDGTYAFDRYLRSERSELDLLRSRIGYTPDVAPGLTFYGGAGWETGEWDFALTSGIELSSGNEDIRISIGAEAVHLQTEFQRGVRVWQDGALVETDILEEGHRWRTSIGLRAGVKLFVLAWGASE